MSIELIKEDLVYLLLTRKYFFIHGKSKRELLSCSFSELESLLEESRQKIKVMEK